MKLNLKWQNVAKQIGTWGGSVFLKSKYKALVKGRGINSSQSKNVGKIQLSKQLSHLSIIFENIWF